MWTYVYAIMLRQRFAILTIKSYEIFIKVQCKSLIQYLGEPWSVIGRAASLYTDPFIMLSGLLTAYSFLGRIKKTGHLNIKNEYLSRFFR